MYVKVFLVAFTFVSLSACKYFMQRPGDNLYIIDRYLDSSFIETHENVEFDIDTQIIADGYADPDHPPLFEIITHLNYAAINQVYGTVNSDGVVTVPEYKESLRPLITECLEWSSLCEN